MGDHHPGRLAAVVVAVVGYIISLVFNALAVVGVGKNISSKGFFFFCLFHTLLGSCLSLEANQFLRLSMQNYVSTLSLYDLT